MSELPPDSGVRQTDAANGHRDAPRAEQFLRHYLEHYPIAPGRIQELGERRRRFVEACRAREAAFDAEYQRNPQRMDFDILTFTVALTASEVINPLIEELGCDKYISRE
ncbi:EP300-interacting inhibitor of differentiation 2-like isoform X2 [Panthera leo]|uniref:EP300-interacting inhibitor of differentiation 2-like isoform X2 n=1 Tax=Panthera leo TaxID=9689 RepID=UPI001C698D9B|nr:EP300-interacting inhibitor of differentiation 2-like isoform X2 [Panthera leo]